MLAPWKKSYDQPRQHNKKQRHYFAQNLCLFKAMVLPVVMHGYESWTIKKAEQQRTDAFELWCWRRLLGVPGTARRSNLKEINPKYSLERQGSLTCCNDGVVKSQMRLSDWTTILRKVYLSLKVTSPTSPENSTSTFPIQMDNLQEIWFRKIKQVLFQNPCECLWQQAIRSSDTR